MILGQLSMGARQTKNAPLLIYMWSQENGFPHVWVIYFRLCVIYVQAGWFVWCAKRASAVYWHLWYWVSTINWIGRKGHLQFIGFLGHYFTPDLDPPKSDFLTILFILVVFPMKFPLKPKKATTMERKGPRVKTKIDLKSMSKLNQLGSMHNLEFQRYLTKNPPSDIHKHRKQSSILFEQNLQHCQSRGTTEFIS